MFFFTLKVIRKRNNSCISVVCLSYIGRDALVADLTIIFYLAPFSYTILFGGRVLGLFTTMLVIMVMKVMIPMIPMILMLIQVMHLKSALETLSTHWMMLSSTRHAKGI